MLPPPRLDDTATEMTKLTISPSLALSPKIKSAHSREFSEDPETWPVTADDYEILETIGKGATATASFFVFFRVNRQTSSSVVVLREERTRESCRTHHVRPAPGGFRSRLCSFARAGVCVRVFEQLFRTASASKFAEARQERRLQTEQSGRIECRATFCDAPFSFST